MNKYTVLVTAACDTWEVRYIWADRYIQEQSNALVFYMNYEREDKTLAKEVYRIAPGQWRDVMNPDCKIGNLERTEDVR